MLFLHVILPSVRMMNTYVKMIRDHFPMEEHRFLFFDDVKGEDRALLDYGNCVETFGSTNERYATMRKNMDEANVVIWHGLLFGAKFALLPIIYRKYMRKSVWIMRGLDLYNWKRKDHGIKASAVNLVNYLCRKGMPYVGAIFPKDEKVYRKQFGNRGKCFYLPYPMAETAFEMMEVQRNSAPRANGKVYIQVANNAYTFNNHLQILEDLQHFKGENIRVIIPLSYGNDWYNKDEKYVSKVMAKAEEYFGQDAACLTRLIPPDKYTELLCNTDVSVYRSNRQNALGNIVRSLYVGNKVFLSQENPLYSFFHEQNVVVCDADDIPNMTFEEFIEPVDGSGAVEWIRRTFHPETNVFYWKQMFDHFGKSRHGKREDAGSAPTLDQEIDAAMQRVFPPENDRHAAARKLNYIDLSRYMLMPVGSKISEVRDVFVLGTDHLAKETYYEMLGDNKSKMSWAIKGFLDDELETIDGIKKGCDVVGTIRGLTVEQDAFYLNALDDVASRRNICETLHGKKAKLLCYVSGKADVSEGADLDDGCIILGRSTVCADAHIGEGTVLRTAFVEHCAEIGAFCTLESGAWIGEGAVIGAGAVIGSGTRVLPHAIVAENQIIQPFSTVC